MRLFVFFLFMLVAACGRPLTENERSFLRGLHGPTLSTENIRISRAPFVGMFRVRYPARPRTTCREQIAPPPDGPWLEGSVAGMAGKRRIYVNPDWYLPDYLPDYPQGLNLAAAMFFAHEMTHIWQYQNRRITGYHPFRGLSEHEPGRDPYLFDDSAAQSFLEYGYEQQASIVEEYLCCILLDPGGSRTGRLRRMLSEVMEPADLTQPISQHVTLPWGGVQRMGICS